MVEKSWAAQGMYAKLCENWRKYIAGKKSLSALKTHDSPLTECFKSNFFGIFKFSDRQARVLQDFWNTSKATLIHVLDSCHVSFDYNQ